MKRIIAYFSIFFVTIFWGTSFVSSKIVLNKISPFELGFYRYIFAALFLLIIFFIVEKDKTIKKQDFPILFLSSFVGVFLYFYAENSALNYLSASVSSIILSMLPIFMIIVNFFINKEKISKTKITAVLASIIGVFFVVRADFSATVFSNEIKGYSFMLFAIITWIIYVFTTLRLRKKYSNLKIITYQAVISLILFAPFSVSKISNVITLNYEYWLNIAYLGIFCSGIAFYLYVYAIKNLGTIVSSIFINFIPVVTIVTGSIILDETLNLMQIIGVIIIFLVMCILVFNDYLKFKGAKK
ncbi:MAG: DMT family transporter [Bacilli bacterium]